MHFVEKQLMKMEMENVSHQNEYLLFKWKNQKNKNKEENLESIQMNLRNN